MHENVTCKSKNIIGSAQSNPTSTHHFIIVNTSKMHETLWKCKCDAMHELLTSFEQNSSQKLHKNLNNFEKQQNLSKTPKFRSKGWNAWLNARKEIILEEGITLEAEDWVRKRFWEREVSLGRWEVRKYRERSVRNEEKSHWPFIQKSMILDGSRCPQQKNLDGSRSYRAYGNFLDGTGSCREAIKINSQKLR